VSFSTPSEDAGIDELEVVEESELMDDEHFCLEDNAGEARDAAQARSRVN